MEKLDNIKRLIDTEAHYERTRLLFQELQSTVQASKTLAKYPEKIYRASDLMLLAHFDQKDRPDGQPYINHPLDVALHLVQEYKINDVDLTVAALLHDTVEDNPRSILIWGEQEIFEDGDIENQALTIIDAQFGKSVSSLVGKLTNPDFDAEVKRLAKNKGEEDNIKAQLYLEHFEHIYDDNAHAFAIKMSDFSQNALHIDGLDESPKKDWFRRKYGPVILMVIRRLAELEDPEHPLFSKREAISKNLTEVYKRDYFSAI